MVTSRIVWYREKSTIIYLCLNKEIHLTYMNRLIKCSLFWAFAIPIFLLIAWILVMLLWDKREASFIMCTLAFGSFFFSGCYISNYVQKEIAPNDRIIPLDEYDEEPKLTTINGFGTRLIPVTGNPYVKYQFFCALFLPVFPLDCYAAIPENNGYRWIGTAEWNTLEVIAIYMQWWGGIIGAISLICTIIVIGHP